MGNSILRNSVSRPRRIGIHISASSLVSSDMEGCGLWRDVV